MKMKEFIGKVVEGLNHYDPVVKWGEEAEPDPILFYCVAKIFAEINRHQLVKNNFANNRELEKADLLCADLMEQFHSWDDKRKS
jgi:hypothetical protein